MVSKLRSWWQQIKQHRVAIGVVGIILVVAIALIIVEVWFNGTGFDGYNQVTTAHTISGPSAGTVTRTEVYQPGKALWDWLQLLIIPVVLAVGALLFNLATTRTEQKIASDKQREDALQAYFDRMSELLFEKNLRESKSDDEVRTMARARTLTVLRTLDADRKGNLIQFLYEERLINKDVSNGIIDLNKVDLTGANLTEANLRYAIFYDADLTGANLMGAKLSWAIFYNAYLRGANLSNTDLSFANLTGADLTGANLMGANLSEARLFGAIATIEQLNTAKALDGAIMPDGSKHP